MRFFLWFIWFGDFYFVCKRVWLRLVVLFSVKPLCDFIRVLPIKESSKAYFLALQTVMSSPFFSNWHQFVQRETSLCVFCVILVTCDNQDIFHERNNYIFIRVLVIWIGNVYCKLLWQCICIMIFMFLPMCHCISIYAFLIKPVIR